MRSGWLGLLGCLLAVLLIGVLVPRPATDVREQWQDIGVGEVGHLRAFDVTVVSARTAASAADDADSDPVRPATEPAAVLVVVRLQLAVRVRPATFNGLSLLTADGRHYDQRSEFASVGPSQTQPGFTQTSSLVFAVPPDRVAGARLEVLADIGTFVGYDRAVRVDLGLDPTASPATVVLDPVGLEVS